MCLPQFHRILLGLRKGSSFPGLRAVPTFICSPGGKDLRLCSLPLSFWDSRLLLFLFPPFSVMPKGRVRQSWLELVLNGGVTVGKLLSPIPQPLRCSRALSTKPRLSLSPRNPKSFHQYSFFPGFSLLLSSGSASSSSVTSDKTDKVLKPHLVSTVNNRPHLLDLWGANKIVWRVCRTVPGAWEALSKCQMEWPRF